MSRQAAGSLQAMKAIRELAAAGRYRPGLVRGRGRCVYAARRPGETIVP